MLVLTSAMRFRIKSSKDAVTSSVIVGAGRALCSNSKSTSKALFFGLPAAETFQKKTDLVYLSRNHFLPLIYISSTRDQEIFK